MTDVKGPKKLFPDLPFGNADLEKAESRKGQLDTFLKVSESICIYTVYIYIYDASSYFLYEV